VKLDIVCQEARCFRIEIEPMLFAGLDVVDEFAITLAKIENDIVAADVLL
jgi:hypothetical protein